VRRELAAAALLALAGFAAATALLHRREVDAAHRLAPGADGTGPEGAAGLWRWAESTGRGPLRVEDGERAPRGAVWILGEPPGPLGDAEAAAFVDHARSGGLSVWALSSSPQPALAGLLGLRRGPASARGETTALAPHPLFRGLTLYGRCGELQSAVPGALPVAGQERSGAPCVSALSVPVGRGEVLVLAGRDLLANATVARGDNLEFWARAAEGGPLAFDERRRAGGALPSLPAGLLAIAGQAALALGLIAWSVLPRLGSIRACAEPGERGTEHYLQSLAALYRRARAEPELVRAAHAELRERLRDRAGIPRALSTAEAARLLERRSPAAAAALEEVAAAAERASSAGPSDLLRVARAASAVEAALSPSARPG